MQMPPGDYTIARVEYQFHCSRCPLICTLPYVIRRNEEIPWPGRIPAGWNKIDERLFCPAHLVQTFVDHKLVGPEGL